MWYLAMVKRKASESIDEWLKEGKFASAARQQTTETATEPNPALPSPTVESAPP